jgi:hypothetical protein
VLELPDGRFGMIDCFRGPFGKPAVPEFLEAAFRSRSRSPLPTRDGLDSLARHTSLLVCTNRAAARRSSARAWDAAAGDPGLPPEWFAAIVADRRFRALLVPPYGSDPAGTDPPAVPLRQRTKSSRPTTSAW